MFRDIMCSLWIRWKDVIVQDFVLCNTVALVTHIALTVGTRMLVAIGTLQHHITLKIWNKGDLKDPFFLMKWQEKQNILMLINQTFQSESLLKDSYNKH